MSIIWLLASLLIFSGYFMLFWFIKKKYLSSKGMSILLGISLISYLVFPNLLNKIDIKINIIILFLFILLGILVTVLIERENKEPFKTYISLNFWALKKAFNNIDLSKKYHLIKKNIINKGIEPLKIKLKKIITNKNIDKSEKQKANDIPSEDSDNKSIDYVNFEQKNDNNEDVFSKYIRGEIVLGDVVKKLKESTSKPKIQSKQSEKTEIFLNNSLEEVITVSVGQEVKEHKLDNKDIPKDSLKKDLLEGELDTNQLTIEQCIECAFELKNKGLFVEAIEYYINVLDKNPDEQLALMIAIDICSLYKQLGEVQTAKEIMQSYMDILGEKLSTEVKEQIMKNI